MALEALPTGLGVACPSIGQSLEEILEQEAVNNPRLGSSGQYSASFWELGPTQVPDCKWQVTPLTVPDLNKLKIGRRQRQQER